MPNMKQHNRFRLNFSSYGVNTRGEIIPVKSYAPGLNEQEAAALTTHALARANAEINLKNVRTLSYL